MKKRKLATERYSIVFSSQTDARKRTLVFNITNRTLVIMLCTAILTVTISAGIIFYSRAKAYEVSTQIAQIKSNCANQTAYVDQQSSSLEAISSFKMTTSLSDSIIDINTHNSDNVLASSSHGLKNTSVSQQSIDIKSEKTTIAHAGMINEGMLDQAVCIPMTDAINIINLQFQSKIDESISSVLASEDYDEYTVVYDVEDGTSITDVDNWSDVLSVFIAYNMRDNQKLLTIQPNKIELLGDIFYDMNEIDIHVTNAHADSITDEPNEQKSATITVHISIKSLTHKEGSKLYSLDKRQMKKLELLMSSDYDVYFSELLGIDTINNIENEQVSEIIATLPDTKGADAVKAALIRLGSPYSKTWRGSGNYVDCSYLTWWAYDQAGISIPTSSVEQALYCHNNGLTVEESELQPGDLIFWTKKSCHCGRWHEIHHVGIYIGDGNIIDATSNTDGVVVRPMWGENGATWKVYMYGHPF